MLIGGCILAENSSSWV